MSNNTGKNRIIITAELSKKAKVMIMDLLTKKKLTARFSTTKIYADWWKNGYRKIADITIFTDKKELLDELIDVIITKRHDRISYFIDGSISFIDNLPDTD